MALTFYHACFGGTLHFETFDKKLEGYEETLIVSGSLVSDRLIIHGSDLVHDEGRKLGNYMSIFLLCNNSFDRTQLVEKLQNHTANRLAKNDENQKLIEVIDAFDVRWILGI